MMIVRDRIWRTFPSYDDNRKVHCPFSILTQEIINSQDRSLEELRLERFASLSIQLIKLWRPHSMTIVWPKTRPPHQPAAIHSLIIVRATSHNSTLSTLHSHRNQNRKCPTNHFQFHRPGTGWTRSVGPSCHEEELLNRMTALHFNTIHHVRKKKTKKFHTTVTTGFELCLYLRRCPHPTTILTSFVLCIAFKL